MNIYIFHKSKYIPKILYYWRSHPLSVAADINAKTYAIDAAKRAVRDYCKDKGMTWSASPWDMPSLEFMLKYDVPYIKVASASNGRDEMIAEISMRTDIPMDEVEEVLDEEDMIIEEELCKCR